MMHFEYRRQLYCVDVRPDYVGKDRSSRFGSIFKLVPTSDCLHRPMMETVTNKIEEVQVRDFILAYL